MGDIFLQRNIANRHVASVYSISKNTTTVKLTDSNCNPSSRGFDVGEDKFCIRLSVVDEDFTILHRSGSLRYLRPFNGPHAC